LTLKTNKSVKNKKSIKIGESIIQGNFQSNKNIV